MRWLVATISLWIFSQIAPMAAVDRPVYLRTVWVNGQEYVNLSDWAQARLFQMFWPLHGEDITISSRWAKMALRIKSRMMEINGVNITLSLPLVTQHDAVYISRLDLRTLIHPILYPGRPDRPKKILRVALDPGHGGKDPGNEAGGEQEKKQTLLLVKEIQKRLTIAGVKPILIRSTDSYVENHDRPALAKKQKADIFISFHFNSVPSGHSDVNGIEVYCLTPAGVASTNDPGDSGAHNAMPGNHFDEQNALLAYSLQKHIVALGLTDRGLKRARYTVLCYADMPAVLIEGGFMSEPREAKRICSAAYRRDMSIAIVDSILAYKRFIERPAPPVK